MICCVQRTLALLTENERAARLLTKNERTECTGKWEGKVEAGPRVQMRLGGRPRAKWLAASAVWCTQGGSESGEVPPDARRSESEDGAGAKMERERRGEGRRGRRAWKECESSHDSCGSKWRSGVTWKGQTYRRLLPRRHFAASCSHAASPIALPSSPIFVCPLSPSPTSTILFLLLFPLSSVSLQVGPSVLGPSPFPSRNPD